MNPSLPAQDRHTRVSILHRTFSRPMRSGEPDGVSTGRLTLLITAAWFGVVTGGLEGVARLVRGAIDPRVPDSLLRINRHWAWMLPLSDLLIFGAVGLFLALAATIWSRYGRRLAFFVLCGLTFTALLLNVHGIHPLACVALGLGLASRIAPRVERAPKFGKLVRLSLPAMLGIGSVLGFLEYRRVVSAEANAFAALPPAPTGTPNVLLLVMDTVRADSLSLYGYGRETSPNLARLARDGVRFERARSTAPWTLPSHASMFTGRWPHELPVQIERALDDTTPTLAAFLASRGYDTGGFVGNTHYCNDGYGIGRGFIHYEDYPEKTAVSVVEVVRSSEIGRQVLDTLVGTLKVDVPGVLSPRKTADGINRNLLAWLSRPERGQRPFFGFVNYIDAHDPYVLPPGTHRHFGRKPETPAHFALLEKWFRTMKPNLRQDEVDLARDSYDDCIAYLDGQIGALLDECRRRGLLDNTVVIVTADHGEMWGEHQIFGHGRSLYRPEVHVPLVIAGPAAVPEGKSVPQAVSLRELPATVVGLLGLDRDSPFPGRNLARFWGPEPPPADPLLAEVAIRQRDAKIRTGVPALLGPMESLIAWGKTYLRNPGGQEELYDLERDPQEAHNLVAFPEMRAELQKFRAEMQRMRKGRGDEDDHNEDQSAETDRHPPT